MSVKMCVPLELALERMRALQHEAEEMPPPTVLRFYVST